jgi:hypothetical protein
MIYCHVMFTVFCFIAFYLFIYFFTPCIFLHVSEIMDTIDCFSVLSLSLCFNFFRLF